MGKPRSVRRVLGAWILVLAGSGTLMLAGTGTATAQSPGSSAIACDNIVTAFDTLNAYETKNPHASVKDDSDVATPLLTKAEVGGDPAVLSAVGSFLNDLHADAASGHVNRPQILADASAILAACPVEPAGAPATGGGSTAGVQQPALFGVAGAAILAGIAVLGLSLRNQSRRRLGHG